MQGIIIDPSAEMHTQSSFSFEAWHHPAHMIGMKDAASKL